MTKAFFLKTSFLLCCFWAVTTISCNEGIDCNCPPDVLPFMDYHGLALTPSDTLISPNDTLSVIINPSSIEFLAQKRPTTTWGNMAYACSCVAPSYEGQKFDITAAEVIPLDGYFLNLPPPVDDFSLSLSAKVYNLETQSEEIIPFTELANHQNFNFSYSPIELIWNTRPHITDAPLRFEIRITKSNGAMVSQVTEAISWE